MGLNEDLQAAWGTTEFLGPVLTDFKGAKKDVKLVIVCESPSDDEVDLRVEGGEAIRPANGTTGGNIARAIAKFDALGRRATRDDLPRLGYYLTNLVSYRADVGLKVKEPDRAKRHRLTMTRIGELWARQDDVGEAVRAEIIDELSIVVGANPKIGILFACGVHRALAKVVKCITSDPRFAHVDWVQAKHPSIWSKCHYLLIDPARWDDMARVDHCGICQYCPRLEKLRPKRVKAAGPTTVRKKAGGGR